MSDPMLVRRLAVDLRALSDKTLALRGMLEDYRRDVLRSHADGRPLLDAELLGLQRELHTLWAAMDRVEEQLRDSQHSISPLLWRE